MAALPFPSVGSVSGFKLVGQPQVQVNGREQWLAAHEALGGGCLEQDGNALIGAGLVLGGDAEPDVGQVVSDLTPAPPMVHEEVAFGNKAINEVSHA
jgi:hypothetical protein